MEDNTIKFIDDKIEHIESDLEKIRKKPTMYIGYVGHRGALHLCKELINNAIDECINSNSPGDTIDIFLDEAENVINVTDNGRGIPFEMMEIVCTTLQSGSKFTREGSGGSSAGENGVGLTACNGLAQRFEIISTRYGERSKIVFNDSILDGKQSTTKIKNPDKHGTTFIMQPSREYLGHDCDIISDNLLEWIEMISYLLPSNIKINVGIRKKGKESLVNKKFSNKYGLYDLVKKNCKKSIIDPIQIKNKIKTQEKIHDKLVNRFLGLEVAFTYDPSSVEFRSVAFCNFVNNLDGGVHVDAAKTAILQYLTKQTKESLNEREAKKIDITFNDAIQGLYLTVYLCTDMSVQFSAQSKDKMSNNDLFKPIRDMTYRGLVDYFNNNPKELKKIIDKIKVNAKARIESTKVRNSVIKGETNIFSELLIENFVPANNKAKNEYRELMIIEGKSARGTTESGRFDRDTQAVFSIRGVPLNAFNTKLDKVLANEEFKSLVSILGCNIGERFDLDKLKYNKIILLADADSDGFNITSLLCAFFLTHLPKIIKDGRLYKSVSPLYRIKSKYKEFILNKQEYFEIFERHVRDNLTIVNPTTNIAYTDKELVDILNKNRDYLDDLIRLSGHLVINQDVLEYILIHRHEKDFYKKFKKQFSELTIDDDNVLTGIHDGRYQILIMDKLFDKRVKDLEAYINSVSKELMYFNVFEKTNNGSINKGIMSLGQFLTECQKFQPIIKTRYKGVGELDADDLRNNTLDPRNRILIRLTIDDIERDLQQFNMLHGDGTDERKLMMKHFKLSRDDLDN